MKRVAAFILTFSMVLSMLTLTAAGAGVTAQGAADALHEMGLFNGVGTKSDGTPDYNLTGGADRETATTMLVRILGKESEASKGANPCKFTDVSSWAKNNVGWASAQGYVNGYGGTSFGGKDAITAQQFLSICLRALGYTDKGSNADFTYDGACAFAAKVGLTDGGYTNSTKSFTRGDIAIICYNALATKVNGSSKTLYQTCFSGNMVMVSTGSATATATSSSTTVALGTAASASSDGVTVIDYSNASQGYVQVKTTQSGDPKLLVQVTGPSGDAYRYYYTSSNGTYDTFPLTEGSGSYKISVHRNTTGTKYVTLHSTTITATITDSLAPFRRANFFVDYTQSTACVQKAVTLCSGLSGELDKVQKIYEWVINYFSYDYDKAATVQSGYRPNLDNVYSLQKGICFDYAATMTAMLRSQGVPTKLVVGYAGTQYHAWISVYTQTTGWVESVIYFDGVNWKLMDPTYASTGKSSSTIMDYINNPDNYAAKYVY